MIRIACRFRNGAFAAAPLRYIGSGHDDVASLPWVLLRPRETPVKADILKLFDEAKNDVPRALALLEQYKSSLDYPTLLSIHSLTTSLHWPGDSTTALHSIMENAFLHVLSTEYSNEKFMDCVERLARSKFMSKECLAKLESMFWSRMDSLTPAEILKIVSTLSRFQWRPNNDGLGKLVTTLTQLMPKLPAEEASHLSWLVIYRHRFYTDDLVKACKAYVEANWRKLEGAQVSRLAHVFLYCNQSEPFEQLNKAAEANLHTMTTSHVSDFVTFAGHAQCISQRFLYKLAKFSRGFWQHFTALQLSRVFVTFCFESPHSVETMQEILDRITTVVPEYDEKRLNRILAVAQMVDCLDLQKFHYAVRRHVEQNKGLVLPAASASQFIRQHVTSVDVCRERCDQLTTSLRQSYKTVRHHDITTVLTMCVNAQYHDHEFLALAVSFFKSEINRVRDLRHMSRVFCKLLRGGQASAMSAVMACHSEVIRRCTVLHASGCVTWTEDGFLALKLDSTSSSVSEVSASDLITTCTTLLSFNYADNHLRAVIALLAGNSSFALGCDAGEFVLLVKLLRQAGSLTPDVSRDLAVTFIKVHLSLTMKRVHMVSFLQEMSASTLPNKDFKDLVDGSISATGDLTAVELVQVLHIPPGRNPPVDERSLLFQKMLLPIVGNLQGQDLHQAWRQVGCHSARCLPALQHAIAEAIFHDPAKCELSPVQWIDVLASSVMLPEQYRRRGLEGLAHALRGGQTLPGTDRVYDNIPMLCTMMHKVEFAPIEVLDTVEQLFAKYPNSFQSCRQILPTLKTFSKPARPS
eukprot:scpid45693/ scgid24970/ 